MVTIHKYLCINVVVLNYESKSNYYYLTILFVRLMQLLISIIAVMLHLTIDLICRVPTTKRTHCDSCNFNTNQVIKSLLRGQCKSKLR